MRYLVDLYCRLQYPPGIPTLLVCGLLRIWEPIETITLVARFLVQLLLVNPAIFYARKLKREWRA